MFDISQTRGRPLPQPLHHESEELIAAMIRSSPVGLQLSEQLPAQIQAQYVPAQRTIYLRNGMDAGVTFCCLARELVHAEYARLPGYRRRDFPAQAYCAAYVLTQRYAVPAPPFQFDRITADLAGEEPQLQRQFLSGVKTTAYSVSRQLGRGLREPLEQTVSADYEFTAPQPEAPKKPPRQAERG